MSVRAKLVGSFSLLSVLVVATILAGLAAAGSARAGATTARRDLEVTRVVKQLQLDAASVAVAENSVAFDYTSHGPASGDLAAFGQGVTAYATESALAGRLGLDGAEQADLARADAAFVHYRDLSRRINADYAAGTRASLADAAQGVAALSFGTITAPLAGLVDLTTSQVNAATAASLSAASGDQGLLVGVGIFVVLLALASAVVIVRAIARPISALSTTLAAVAAGDLSVRADVASGDELGRLAGALNTAVDAQEHARQALDRQGRAQAEMSADNAAVLEVLGSLRAARTTEEAVALALEAIRSRFGWAYASYFALDPAQRLLVLTAETGADGQGEIARLGRSAAIAPGADLDGRAAAERALVTSDGLADLADSPRAVAARRQGIQAAAAFPVVVGNDVVGTMSFFGPPGGPALTSWRANAMAHAGQVVSTAVERIADQERERLAERDLRAKVDQILEVVSAAASGDLTVHVPVSGTDAIGRVGTSLSRFLGDLRDRMQAIGENTAGLAGAIGELSGRSDHGVAFAGPREGSLETVAAAAEELTASIQEIARSAADAARVALEAASAAESTNSTVRSLGDSSAEIGQVIKTITVIAEQTNMLALNATIEAARAGAAGKGFAVVASEVKELAQETTTATEDISSRIQAIQHDAGEAVAAIRAIKEIVDQINELQSSIASAVEEQTATTDEIARSMSGAAQATGEIGRMTTELQGLIARFTY